MNNRNNTWFNFYQSFISLALPTALTGTTTYLCYNGIQEARNLDPSNTKDNLKDMFSLVSSSVSAGSISYKVCDFFTTLFNTGIWKELSCSQGFIISVTATTALAGTIYSMADFGVEHNTLSAGLSATASIVIWDSAKHLATFFHNRLITQEERALLTEHNADPSYRV